MLRIAYEDLWTSSSNPNTCPISAGITENFYGHWSLSLILIIYNILTPIFIHDKKGNKKCFNLIYDMCAFLIYIICWHLVNLSIAVFFHSSQ